MSFDTSWDVEKYKTDYEPDEHWKLRKDFLSTHKEKYPEDRLVCLAQVFYNVEFMGCRYPEETMKLVEELTKDVAADHREKQKTKLQRTFVQASDAAGAKIKGQRGNLQAQKKGPVNFVSSAETLKTVVVERRSVKRNAGCLSNVEPKKMININDVKQTHGPVGEMFIIWRDFENPSDTLLRNAQYWKKKLDVDTVFRENSWKSSISYDSVIIGTGEKSTKAEAALAARVDAVNLLLNSYYVLKIKCSFFGGDGDVICKSDSPMNDATGSRMSEVDTPISNDNVGSKLLKLMGWGGGGLGKKEQGISEPVKSTGTIRRAGFGSKEVKPSGDLQTQKRIILEYAKSDSVNDLVFSKEFSNSDREQLHKYAQGRGLKSKSYGKKSNRHLVVSKKVDLWKIVQSLIENEDPFSNKYELLKPGKAKLENWSQLG